MKILRPEVEKDLEMKPGILGICDLMDQVVLSKLNVTKEEMDYISSKMSDEEYSDISNVFNENLSFKEARQILNIKDKYLKEYDRDLYSPHF